MTTYYVTAKLGGGFGNQLFQWAAVLGYAERHGHVPVFMAAAKDERWEHPESTLRIRELFPDVPVLNQWTAWITLKERPDNAFTYKELPYVNNHVMLDGYFQCHQYAPKTPLALLPLQSPVLQTELSLLLHDWPSTFFLHVRRGDYLHADNAHHNVNLEAYWRQCLSAQDPSWTCFVVSDDVAWCQQTLPGLLPEWKGRWLFCPTSCSDAETFFWMTLCGKGAICANSTFSWWAAYFLHHHTADSATCWMPRPWGHPPMPPACDLYPPWAVNA